MENPNNKSLISPGSSNLAKTEKLLSITQKILSEIKPKYESIRIGNQEWMTRNLDVDRFRNGDLIPHIESNEEWKKAGENGQPAWCYYDNDPENGKKYGKLYNWFAVNDPRGLAPEGWHVPADEEWTILMEFLGGKIAGGSMKSIEDWENGVMNLEDRETEMVVIRQVLMVFQGGQEVVTVNSITLKMKPFFGVRLPKTIALHFTEIYSSKLTYYLALILKNF